MNNKVIIIHTNYGPYHITRVNCLSKIYKGEIIPIQLAREEKLRSWRTDNSKIQIFTIQEKPLEDTNASELSSGLVLFLEKIRPDIVVVAGYAIPPMRSAARWARRNGRISILLSDSHYLDRKRIWLKERVKGLWIKKYFDSAFVAGERSADYLKKLGFPADRIWRGYDVVDNEYFMRKSAEVRMNEKEWREKLGVSDRFFLYVGRFSPEKNLLNLLEAYRIYQDMVKENAWGFVFVGSGPQEQEIISRADKLGLKNLIFPGFKQIDELPQYYALASCFIIPSISEAWGLVVNEAMACGLPVLVSERCGCVPELVHPGINGYIFNPLDIEQIAYYMMRVSSGEIDLNSFGEASRKIIANYTPETWARALADCINVTIARKSRK